MMPFVSAASLLGLALVLVSTTAARAAELRVLAGGSMTAVLGELGPRFERETGHKLSIQFGATPELIKLAVAGPFDLGVVPSDLFRDAGARARFVPGPTTDITRIGFGVAVRAGAAKPDVSTAEALKRTLLEARSVTFLPESAAGAQVIRVFERLGIADAMKAKTVAQTSPPRIPQAVAAGEAELGVFLVNVLMAPGVELAGPFPGDLQQELVITASVAADTKEPEAARAFIAYLRSAPAVALMRAKGLNPG